MTHVLTRCLNEIVCNHTYGNKLTSNSTFTVAYKFIFDTKKNIYVEYYLLTKGVFNNNMSA